MVTFSLHRLLRLKSKYSYATKGSVDKIQGNGLILQDEWFENPLSNNITYLAREAIRKRY